MLAAVDDVLARVYPTRTWGEPAVSEGVGAEDGAALAEELATELGAATFYVPGGPDELCDYVWILALGRTPCLLQVRDLGAAPAPEMTLGPVRERYLRVCLSSVARVAAVQEVALESDPTPGGWVIAERPRAGVYDAPLLRRFQRLVAILPAYDLLHVDFGEIAAPPPGFAPGAWPALYGAPAPSVANYLFFPEPATMAATTFVPVEGPCSTTR